jgi:thioredoxin-like negative regulator of GroEL
VHLRQTVVVTCLLVAGALLAASCVSTTAPGTAGPGRMEELVGMEAVKTVLSRASGPCVLIYHSPRCDFCRSTLRSAEAVLPDLSAQDRIYTVDIDVNQDVAEAMGIGPVPVVLFLRDGKEVKRWRMFRPGFAARGSLRRFFAQ